MSADRGPRLFANAAFREHKAALAKMSAQRPSLRERLACAVGFHDWFLDGGSVEEPRYAGDEPREFCSRPFCSAQKGAW